MCFVCDREGGGHTRNTADVFEQTRKEGLVWRPSVSQNAHASRVTEYVMQWLIAAWAGQWHRAPSVECYGVGEDNANHLPAPAGLKPTNKGGSGLIRRMPAEPMTALLHFWILNLRQLWLVRSEEEGI